MTAAAASTNSRARGPRIGFFWWLNQIKASAAPSAIDETSQDATAFSEASFIPSSTADLWKSCKPGH